MLRKVRLKWGICLIFGLLDGFWAIEEKEKPMVLLISMDGFRYNLVNQTTVPHIYKWAREGVWFVNGSESQYVTYTAPNHMSIATGLYEQNHGIVSNFFFDHDDDIAFDYFNYTGGKTERELQPRWYLGEPIWLTNEKQGGRSSVMDWPMSDAEYSMAPHKPHWNRAWKRRGNLSNWIEDIDTLLEQFIHPMVPSNLGLLYIAEPDMVLHGNGFYNGEFEKTIKALDKSFDYLVERIKALDLEDRLNIILTADHGHAEIESYKSVFCIRDYVLGGGFEIGDHMIYPKDEAHGQEVFKNLTRAVNDGYKVEILWKKDIPKSWHYANSSRVGQIIINPKLGSGLSFSCEQAGEKLYGPNGTVKFNSSTHGMDPKAPEMRALLAMNGPAFIKRKMVLDIPMNIDLYSFICHLLKIRPSPNNGSLTVLIQACNKEKENEHLSIFNFFTDSLGFLVFLVPSLCIVLLILSLMCRNILLKNDPQWARPEATRGYRPLSANNDDEEDDLEIGVHFTRRDDPIGRVNVTTRRGGGLLENTNSSDEDI